MDKRTQQIIKEETESVLNESHRLSQGLGGAIRGMAKYWQNRKDPNSKFWGTVYDYAKQGFENGKYASGNRKSAFADGLTGQNDIPYYQYMNNPYQRRNNFTQNTEFDPENPNDRDYSAQDDSVRIKALENYLSKSNKEEIERDTQLNQRLSNIEKQLQQFQQQASNFNGQAQPQAQAPAQPVQSQAPVQPQAPVAQT